MRAVFLTACTMFVLLAGTGLPASGGDNEISDLRARIDKLETRIDELEARRPGAGSQFRMQPEYDECLAHGRSIMACDAAMRVIAARREQARPGLCASLFGRILPAASGGSRQSIRKDLRTGGS